MISSFSIETHCDKRNSTDNVIPITTHDEDNIEGNESTNAINRHDANNYLYVTTNHRMQDRVMNFVDPPENDDSSFNLETQTMRPSSSIEAVNLNSWPTSSNETTPEQHKDKLGTTNQVVILSMIE